MISFIDLFAALPSKSEEEVISNNLNGFLGRKLCSKQEEEKELKKSSSKVTDNDNEDDELEYIEQLPKSPPTDVNSFDESADNFINDQQAKSFKTNGVSVNKTQSKLNSNKENSNKKGKIYSKEVIYSNNKDEVINRFVDMSFHPVCM